MAAEARLLLIIWIYIVGLPVGLLYHWIYIAWIVILLDCYISLIYIVGLPVGLPVWVYLDYLRCGRGRMARRDRGSDKALYIIWMYVVVMLYDVLLCFDSLYYCYIISLDRYNNDIILNHTNYHDIVPYRVS